MPVDPLVERFHKLYGSPTRAFSGVKAMLRHVENKIGRDVSVIHDFRQVVPLRGKILSVVRKRRPPLVQAIFNR